MSSINKSNSSFRALGAFLTISMLVIVSCTVPMIVSGSDSVATDANGIDGGIEWNYDASEKTLTIEASVAAEQPGVMNDYREGTAPWLNSIGVGTKLVIKDGVKNIGDYAFGGCTKIKGSLEIPGTVERIGKKSFTDCSRLTELTISEGVEVIDYCAFDYCSGFKGELRIPDTVKSVGDMAFANSGSFQSLTLGKSLETIGDMAFMGFRNVVGELVIPDSVKTVGEYAFSYGKCLTKITIGDGVKYIGEKAFFNCTNCRELIIGKQVETIDKYAFLHCYGLNRITFLSDSLIDVDPQAFSDFKFLKEDGITEIDLEPGELCGYTFEGSYLGMVRQPKM